MDISIVETAPAEILSTGETTAPAHTLYEIVRKLPEGAEVSFEVAGDNARMTLAAGRSNFALTTLPKEDFPAVGDGVLPQSFAMAASELKNLIDRTRFAISTEETRYYLNGIYLHAASTGDLAVLRAVATDGHRLARFEMPLPEGAADMPAVIVPRKTVGELRKLIDEIGGSVEISLSETQIRFAFAETVLTSKLIDGTFPDYERVIPSGNDKVMEVDRKTFADAVDRVSTISTEKSRAVKLSLEADTLTLSANSPESGSAVEEIEVSYGGDPMEIGFNPGFIIDALKVVDGSEVMIELKAPNKPGVIRTGNDFTYVIMPVNLA